MNKTYYDRIGKYMIHSWIMYAPEDYRLHLYLEDFNIILNDNRIILESWKEIEELFTIWKNTHHCDNLKQQKFTLKALSQIALFRKLEDGKVFWIDADVIFLDKLPTDFFDSILEEYPLASWGEYSFESGTIWIDISHPKWNLIQKEYEDIYLGEKGLSDGERWFDGELLGRAVKDSGVKINNLRKLTTKKTSTPLNWAWTGKYLRHFKAKGKKDNRFINELKELGKSHLIENFANQ